LVITLKAAGIVGLGREIKGRESVFGLLMLVIEGEKTYKLFNAIQSLSGTMPYQQFPAQLVWSQRRIPPMLRLARGLARVVVVVRRRVARRKGNIVERIWEELSTAVRFGGCNVLVFPAEIFPVV
jgi:hypothetical protein